MSIPLAAAPSVFRLLLGQVSGVRFVEAGGDDIYKVFDADLSPCIALAGADALGYVELHDPLTSLSERARWLREFLPSRFAHARTIVVDVDGDSMGRELASFGTQIVCLAPGDIQAADSPNGAAALVRQRLRDGANLETLVLYRYLGAVTGHRFFGRDAQIDAILKRPHEGYLVTGARMSGKSSLLLESKRRLEAGVRARSDPFAVYVDLKRYFDIPSVISAILLGLQMRESITYSKKWPSNRWPEFFRLLRTYAKNLPGRRLTLFVDEFDRLVDLDVGACDTFTWSMRSLHQDNSATQGWVQFVVAGSKRLAKLADNQKSALNNFVNTEDCRLTNFSVGTVREVATGPVEALGMEVPEPLAVAQAIFASTAGRPSSVQYLCDRTVKKLLQERRRVLTVDAVQEIVQSPEYLHYYQKQVFENTDALAQFVLAAFAARGWFSAEDVHQALDVHDVLSEQSAIINSLTDLANSGFLMERQRGGALRYELATPVLRKVFAATPARRYVDEMLQKSLVLRRR